MRRSSVVCTHRALPERTATAKGESGDSGERKSVCKNTNDRGRRRKITRKRRTKRGNKRKTKRSAAEDARKITENGFFWLVFSTAPQRYVGFLLDCSNVLTKRALRRLRCILTPCAPDHSGARTRRMCARARSSRGIGCVFRRDCEEERCVERSVLGPLGANKSHVR